MRKKGGRREGKRKGKRNGGQGEKRGSQLIQAQDAPWEPAMGFLGLSPSRVSLWRSLSQPCP